MSSRIPLATRSRAAANSLFPPRPRALTPSCSRCVAAPLNPAYNAAEVSFYLEDTKSKLLFVPAGAIAANAPAVQAAKKLSVPVAEVHFDGKSVSVRFQHGKVGGGGSIQGSGRPQEADIALVLHTSGTTGKPKGQLRDRQSAEL